jgi:hypothetical protein
MGAILLHAREGTAEALDELGGFGYIIRNSTNYVHGRHHQLPPLRYLCLPA